MTQLQLQRLKQHNLAQHKVGAVTALRHTLTPRLASSNATGSKVRLTRQWSSVSLPWMTKKRVVVAGSSTTYHSVGLARAACQRTSIKVKKVKSGSGGDGCEQFKRTSANVTKQAC